MYVYVCVYCMYLESWYTQEVNKMAHTSVNICRRTLPTQNGELASETSNL